MIKKIINYWERSLDYPVDANEKDKFTGGNHYFLDLSSIFDSFPFNHLIYDSEGIVRYDYGKVKQPNQSLGIQYNNTYICWWALSRLEIFLNTGDQGKKNEFLKHAEWLLRNKQDRNGFVVWPLKFDYRPELHWLRAPWVSAMDQGLIISVLVRAYKITKDERYLDLTKKAGLYYAIPFEEGGFRTRFKNDDYYYEMYPVYPFSRILDGFLFSLMGLYDLLSVWEDKRIQDLYNAGLNTLLKHVEYWDFRGYWSRFGTYYLSPPWYHKLNYAWIKAIFALTNDEQLSKIIEGWNPENLSNLEKAKVKIYSFLLSRKLYGCLGIRKLFRTKGNN